MPIIEPNIKLMYMDQWQHIINNAYSALLGSYNSAIAKQEKGTVLDKVNAELLKNLIYNPATKQVFPQSPLHEKDPEKLAMNLVVGMTEPIKEKTPLTADWDTAVDIVRSAGTKGQASLDDIMKAVDTVKAEMGRQMTPEELAKNKSIDRAIDMIQPRVDAEMGGKLPKQLPKELEGLGYSNAEDIKAFKKNILTDENLKRNISELSKDGLSPDENGLVTLYRGHSGKGNDKFRAFSYFSTNKNLAQRFGRNVETVKVNPRDLVITNRMGEGITFQNPVNLVKDANGIYSIEPLNQSKGVQSKGGVK